MPSAQPVPDDAEQIVVHRSGPLVGRIDVPGAKNSVLKLMAATLMADGEYVLSNVPAIVDVEIMSDLLAAIGVSTERLAPAEGARGTSEGRIKLVNRGVIEPVAPYELVERIRASINVLGPLLGRFGRVRLSLPGGDDFGSRPIDMHLRGLESMGATFEIRHGYVDARADRLHGAEVNFEFPSVGATENILTAAVHAKGTTVIDNAAREPEIADLCNFLVSMGAHIEGIGSSTLTVHGVERGELHATQHAVVPDRIQAATYLAAVAVSGGEVVLRGARADHMDMLLRRFHDMGLTITSIGAGAESSLAVWSHGQLRSIDVATLPYLGIATDYKPLIV
ncbi:MAG: UDP-N-acetylglucosamine 1-carboxyvinyltransferase, partial [Actinobacteria bacterium]|nr:UDP-N-acetylglucosamine 1-carboxyvinyltransferase [Actinomycetota bacterium]